MLLMGFNEIKGTTKGMLVVFTLGNSDDNFCASALESFRERERDY